MKEIVFDSTAGGGRKVKGFIYSCENSLATLQICHGMAEYIDRYDAFIKFLNDNGISVCGIDMLGHGKTSDLNKDPLGYFSETKDSYKYLIEDNFFFRELVAQTTGQAPNILYGHSMGSFVARKMYSDGRSSADYDIFIFGSTKGPEVLAGFGVALSRLICLLGLSKKTGHLVNAIAFGSYNKRVENRKTYYDWISTDMEEVERYATDPLCGFLFTNKGFYDLLRLVKDIQSKETLDSICKKPCLFLYGTEDPVGAYGKGVEKVVELYRQRGAEVESINFGPYRHELLREPVRQEYMDRVLEFIRRSLKL